MVKSTKPNFKVKHPYGYLIRSILLGLVMMFSAIFSVVSYNFFTKIDKSIPEFEADAETTLPEWDKDWIDTNLNDTIYLATYSSSTLTEDTTSDYIYYYNDGYKYSYVNSGEHNIDSNGKEYFSSKNNFSNTSCNYNTTIHLQDNENNMSAAWVYVALPWTLDANLSIGNNGVVENVVITYFYNLDNNLDITGVKGEKVNSSNAIINTSSVAIEDRVDEDYCYISVYIQALTNNESLSFVSRVQTSLLSSF